MSGTQLAKQMGHSLETAERYYRIETEAEGDARIHRLIDQITHGNVPQVVDVRLPDVSDKPTKEKDQEDGEEKDEDGEEKNEDGKEKDGEEKDEGGEEKGEDCEEKDEGGEEKGKDDDKLKASEDSESLTDAQRHELLRVFEENLKSGRIIMKHSVQARMSRNNILKCVDPEIAVQYLESKKATLLPGVEKARGGLYRKKASKR